jgi:5'-3' exonuclease
MGVPGFFLWLMKNYKKQGFVFSKERLSLVDINKLNSQEQINKAQITNQYIEPLLKEVNSIDWFLIDANCLIHPVCFKVVAENPDIKDNSKLEAKMMIAVLNYLDKIIQYVNPKKGVYLAIDGVAPVAKIKQQRSRRFKSIADKILDDNIRKKYNKDIEPYWNTNAITPGTNFMEKLDERLIKWAKDNKRKIIYSSWKEPGEGEHKLLHFMKDLKSNDLKQNSKHVIYGLDADLIFLALSADMKNIFLMREANQMDNKGDKNDFNFVSIDILKESIIVTMGEFIENLGFEFDNKRLINDFIFLCILYCRSI